MNLLVDIGNSRIKWAVQDAAGITAGKPLERNNKAFKDLARPAWKELDSPKRVLIANVAGTEFQKSVHTWVKRRWKIAPEFLHASEQQCGVTNAYLKAGRLGADRWACLIAAHAQYDSPVVVVDCGTAITIDALSRSGRHAGGLIVPGVALMKSSLLDTAPGIEIQDEVQDISLLGRSTEVGISGGVLYAAVALIDRVFGDLRAELGQNTKLLLTGGDAETLQPLLGSRSQYVPDLVLSGLGVVATATAESGAETDDSEEAQEAVV